MELDGSRPEYLVVLCLGAVFHPVPVAASDGHPKDAVVRRCPFDVERKYLLVVEANERRLAPSLRFGQLVLVVVGPAEPARGKPETGNPVLREKGNDRIYDSSGICLSGHLAIIIHVSGLGWITNCHAADRERQQT